MFGIGNRGIIRSVFILLPSSLLALAVFSLAACSAQSETQTAAPAAASSDPAPAAQVADPNGEEPVEAAQPSGVEALLSGETLAQYRALPPAYRQALELYTEVDVSPDLIPAVVQDKIDQWGDHAIPLAELVGKERVRHFERLTASQTPIQYAQLLSGYYVFLLNTEPDGQRRAEAMGKLVDEIAPPSPPNTVGLDVDESTDPNPPPDPALDWPDLKTFLAPTALARLDTLAPRLQEAIRRPLNVDPIGQVFPGLLKDVAVFMPMYEIFALKAQPRTDLLAMEDVLSADDVLAFQALPAADRERAEQIFEMALIQSYLTATFQPVWADAAAWEEVWTQEYAEKQAATQLEFAVEWWELKQASAGSSLLPPAIQILSPAYQEAYRLLPDGELAQRYFATRFEGFDYQEWSMMDENAPDIVDTPRELDRGNKWKLTRILRDDEEQEWFVRRIRELDADAARSFVATQAEEDRIEILGALFEEGRKDQEILEIILEWEMRIEGLQGEELARRLESYRDMVRHMEELSSLPPKQGTVRLHELSVCDLVSHFVIDGRPSDAASWRAGCDIEASVSAARQALESRGGQPLVDEEEFREMLDSLESLRNPTPEPTPSIDI